MRALAFKVEGRVAGQGSKNKGRGGRFYEASAYLKPWRNEVKAAVQRALETTADFDTHAEGVRVEVTFAFDRPKHHFRSGKFAHLLRENAPLYYAQTPDIDKACRAILDALTQAEAIVDDRRVVQLFATQIYADPPSQPPGAAIVVTPLKVTGEELA